MLFRSQLRDGNSGSAESFCLTGLKRFFSIALGATPGMSPTVNVSGSRRTVIFWVRSLSCPSSRFEHSRVRGSVNSGSRTSKAGLRDGFVSLFLTLAGVSLPTSGRLSRCCQVCGRASRASIPRVEEPSATAMTCVQTRVHRDKHVQGMQ